MVLLSFQNTSSTRRNVLVGIGALMCAPLLPEMVRATTSRSLQQFILEQTEAIEQIVRSQQFQSVFSNRYLASGIYYSGSFLSRLAHPSNQIDVPTTIIGRTAHSITGSYREDATDAFAELALILARQSRVSIGQEESVPLQRFGFGHGTNHSDAIDLFAREGTPVHAFASGIVLVADSGWTPNDERSAASMRGGNTVIVFNHEKSEFYRYAHLDSVSVQTGQIVMSGAQLGTVGNTGTNAMRPGHGGHLHFEVNQYSRDSGENQVVTSVEIRRRLSRLL